MEKRKAFTLIELMGVLVIIGILIVILVPVINNSVKNNKEELYNKQLDLIKLSAKNLASDNEYILPEEDGEEIYLTLGQLRAMGYAEEIITNPKTKENFPDNLVVMIIKVNKDYDYDIILDGGEVLTTSGIIVFNPSKRYIKKGSTSSYIITAKTKTKVDLETTEYYVDMTKSNIVLRGVGETDSSIKYKLDGNKGLYKLTVAGGEKEGYLYFNFKDLKDIEGKEIDTTTINSNINNVSNNKQIIVDNTAPTCSWSGENSTWTNNAVTIKLTGIDNYKMNSSKTTYTKTYNQSGIEIFKNNLSYEIEDEAGNKNTCSKNVNVYYDKKPPTITEINNPTKGNWVNYNFKVTLTVTENGSGIEKEQYSYKSNTGWITDNATISGNTVTTDNFSAERNQLAYIRVCDKVGNCSAQKSTWIRIDKTAPTIPTITGQRLYNGSNVGTYTSNTWTNNDVRMNYSSTDSGVGGVYYQYSHDNSTWINNNSNNGFTSSSTSWTISWESVYNYYIRACDGLNNCSSSSLMTIKIDRTPPVITCNSNNASVKQEGSNSTKYATLISTGDCSAYFKLVNMTALAIPEKNSIFNISGHQDYYTSTKICDDSGNCENASWKKTDGKCVNGYCNATVTATAWDEAGNYTYKNFTYYVKY